VVAVQRREQPAELGPDRVLDGQRAPLDDGDGAACGHGRSRDLETDPAER
jgi:hypothetical protein